MKRRLGYALVLLTASAVASASALGSSLHFASNFFLRGAASAPPLRAGQGYLGVDVRDVSEDELAALKLKQARGAEIVLVDHDAPAGKAGLREHDVILRMNGQAIENEEQIRRMLRESSPGTTIVLLISRDGQQMTVTTQTASREEVERQAWEQHLTVPVPLPLPFDAIGSDPSASADSPLRGNGFVTPTLTTPSYTGAMLEAISAQLAEFFGGSGLLVRSVEANSPAAAAGLRAGDVVVRANARAVVSSADWTRAIRESQGSSLTLVILRNKKEQTLTLTPDVKRRSSLEWPMELQESSTLALLR